MSSKRELGAKKNSENCFQFVKLINICDVWKCKLIFCDLQLRIARMNVTSVPHLIIQLLQTVLPFLYSIHTKLLFVQ